ncbi:hypothetical protein D9599_01720 [Roseomonas sp. KE2513]|uniref:SH3 domain-containing protein n=1 Tax=Roseomonas sp. KE2513 TaxID=2479202 RepID=UPI0018DF61B7|nr:SH3 domain-containing protein [Roseomonas sp. KE2513]MBI0534292.1 hypothetical protein [Roseomonas sp. KE2513]
MRSALLPAAALLLGLHGAANAAPGFAAAPVELRAGPGMEYPPVTFLPGNAPVEIFGCLQGYVWCDVAYGPARGWLPAGYLGYLYENRPLPLPEYGPRFGVPIVGFRFGDYWDRNYRGQPWYAERDRWRGPPPGEFHGPPPPRADFRGPPPPDWRRDGPPGRGPEWRHEGPPGRGPEWRHDGRADFRVPPGPPLGEMHRGPEGGRGEGRGRGPDRGPSHGPERGHDERGPR